MSSSYRTKINKLLSHLTIGSQVDVGRRRNPQLRGRFVEFLESRQLLSVTPAASAIGPISHAAFDFAIGNFQVTGTLTDVEFATLPGHGNLTFNGAPVVAGTTDIPVTQLANLTYTPDAAFGGADVFQWDGSDDNGASFSGSPANLTINVNNRPTLGTPSASIAHDHPLTINVSHFTGAFTDADADPLQSLTFATLPSNGTLKFNGNNIVAGGNLTISALNAGNLTYTPNAGFAGADSFSWNASDGSDNAVANATFSLTVTDTAPTLTNINNANITHDHTLTIVPSLFVSAFADADAGDALSNITFATVPAHGTLKINGSTIHAGGSLTAIELNTGNMTYTPDAGYTGADPFNWNASDGIENAAANATFNINVNDQAPTLTTINNANTTHEHALTISPSLFTGAFADADAGDSLSDITFATLPAHGSLTINGSAIVAGGTLTAAQLSGGIMLYTPDAAYTGADSFFWNASDGVLNAASNATFNINVNDQAPTLTGFTANMTHDKTHSFTAVDFTSHFTDADSDVLRSVTIVSVPTHGNLTLGNTTVTAGAVVSAAQLPTLVYTPNAGYSGPDSFTWNASDGALTAATAASVTFNVIENQPTLTSTGIHAAAGSNTSIPSNTFLTNFHDADTDTIQSVVIKTVPTNGTLTLSNGTAVTPNQTLSPTDLANLTFVPGASYTSSDSFTWNATDGAMFAASDATISFNTDNAPTILPIVRKTVLIGTPHHFTTAEFVSSDSANGTPGYTDPDHDPLFSITITQLPTKGALTLNENPVVANQTIAASAISGLVYTTSSVTANADQFTWTASDGTLNSAPETFVLPIVDPTTQVVSDLSATLGENRNHTIKSTDFSSVATDTGFSISPTTLKIVTLPSHGTLTSGGVPLVKGQGFSIADVTYTPNAGFAGADSFTWTESADNGAHFAPSASVNLTVVAPTDTAISKFVSQNAVNTFTASEFSSHVTPAENGTFSGIQISKLPTNGVLKLGSAAVHAGQIISAANIAFLTYTPKTGFSGADSFLWAGGDGFAIAAPVSADITVVPPLSVIGNGAFLQQNAKPSVANFTDFRNWTIAADLSMGIDTRSFTIRNGSTSDMSFAGISSIGTNKGDFVIIAPDRARLTKGAFVLSPGDTATFQVRFLPHGTGLSSSVIALRNAAGAIVYQFAVQGTGLASRPVVTTTFDSGGNPVKGLVQVATTRNGSGPAAANGHIVSIKYTGYLANSGFVFDDSANHPESVNGFEIRLDSHFTDGSTTSQPFLNKDPNFNALRALNMVDISVIPGWEFALQGIKAGEKRTLVINSNAGYGAQGNTGIPPGATLVFDVECVFVDPSPTIVMATIIPTTDSNGKTTNNIFKLIPGQTATSAESGTLLSLSNTSTSSSVTQTFNFFTIAADDINGNILANVTFNPKKPVTITGNNSPDFTVLGLTTNSFGPAVEVVFHPLSTGLKTIQIHVNSNDSQHPDYNFTVQGNAQRYSDIAAGFDTSLNLPSTAVTAGSGQTVPVAVTITNTGDISLPGNSRTNLQIYAHNLTTGALTLVGFIDNINISGLGVGGVRVFTPQIALPLDTKSPFSKFPGGTYTFTAVVNQAHLTANASMSGLVALQPNFTLATMAEADGSASKMTDNNTSDSASATIATRKPVIRGISVIAGQYVLGGSLGSSTIVASPATGAHGAITIDVKNLGNIQTIPSQTLSIDLFARPIANNNLPTVTLLSNHAISPGRIGVGGTASITIPVDYNTAPRFRNTTYVLFARIKLVDTGGHIIGGQQVISLDRNLNAVLLQA